MVLGAWCPVGSGIQYGTPIILALRRFEAPDSWVFALPLAHARNGLSAVAHGTQVLEKNIGGARMLYSIAVDKQTGARCLR
jgi:hypothetical protein